MSSVRDVPRQVWLRIAVLGALAACLVALLGATTAHAGKSPPTQDARTYRADVRQAAKALNAFSASLRTSRRPESLALNAPVMRLELTRFRRAAAKMDGYRVSNRRLDAQRARIAAKAPPVAETLDEYVDAMLERRPAKIARARTSARRALWRLARALGRDAKPPSPEPAPVGPA